MNDNRPHNERETGPRKYPPAGRDNSEVDPRAAANKRPKPYGLTQARNGKLSPPSDVDGDRD